MMMPSPGMRPNLFLKYIVGSVRYCPRLKSLPLPHTKVTFRIEHFKAVFVNPKVVPPDL